MTPTDRIAGLSATLIAVIDARDAVRVTCARLGGARPSLPRRAGMEHRWTAT